MKHFSILQVSGGSFNETLSNLQVSGAVFQWNTVYFAGAWSSIPMKHNLFCRVLEQYFNETRYILQVSGAVFQ